PTVILFAATEPERTQSLVLHTTTARFVAADDYPFAISSEELRERNAVIREQWGTEELVAFGSRTAVEDADFRRWSAKSLRLSSSARHAAETLAMLRSMDVRQVLPSVRAPTLIIHRKSFPFIPVEQARYLADHLPDARLLLIDGDSP